MSVLRGAALCLLVLVAVILQVAVLRYVAVDGVVPNLALLLVVFAGFTRGPQFAAVMGLGAGLVLDLAPPADHVAGRWALALVVVGYLAGRVGREARSTLPASLLTVGACSFVGTSLYALSGLVTGDERMSPDQMLVVIAVSVGWDVLVTPVVMPLACSALRRLRPPRVAY
ncbi:MAG: rod shape-determining protein MreD [Marmoricola sp.]